MYLGVVRIWLFPRSSLDTRGGVVVDGDIVSMKFILRSPL